MENVNQVDALLKYLFQLTMQRKWDEVARFYETHSWAHNAKLTRSEETALHVAVSSCHSGRTGTKAIFITRMIDSIPSQQQSNTLSMQNNRGNTPLHLAATVGSTEICDHIASKYPELIKIRNSKGETPVYMAARHGNTEAFLCFSHYYQKKKEALEKKKEEFEKKEEEFEKKEEEFEKEKEEFEKKKKEFEEEFESLCRRIIDGNTVLHAAIFGAYFRLAYQIIAYYPKLVNSRNVDGESPLYVLAKKPNVFRSSNYLGFFESIIYSCLIVDELIEEEYIQGANQKVLSPTREINFPENYRTCVNIFHFLWDPIYKSVKAGSLFSSDGFGCDEEKQHKITESQKDAFFPPNYATSILLVKFGFKVTLTVLGVGFWRIQKIQEKKQIWTHSFQVMNKMIELSESDYEYDIDGQKPVTKYEPVYEGRIDELPPTPPTGDIDTHSITETKPRTTPSGDIQNHTDKVKDQSQSVKNGKETPILVAAKMGITEMVDKILEKCPVAILEIFQKHIDKAKDKSQSVKNGKETPILVAAKMGITEMVHKILEKSPVAIQDLDLNEKNVLLLAVENKQTSVFDYLVKLNLPEYMFHQVDNKGNSVLHLAAMFGDSHPWRIPGAALQMQWEMKWYKYVKNSIPQQYLPHYNSLGKTPRQVFTETHRTIVEDGSKWLIKTSESCSLIAALIATVAFATSATVPGGLDQTEGRPLLRDHRAFDVFSISALVALCLSVTALVFFVGIITSRCQERDFKKTLPRKLLMGLTSLFASIAAMLLSFCAGHTFILRDHLKIAAFSIYATTAVPVTLFAIGHLNLYYDLLLAAVRKVPLRSYKVFYQ